MPHLGQSEPFDGAGGGSFLDRERAALGEDAEQFGSTQEPINNATTVEDDDGDLLGGDDFGGDSRAGPVGNDMNEFESSFPAIDTQNEVRSLYSWRRRELWGTVKFSIVLTDTVSYSQNVGPGGSITNTSGSYQPAGYTNYTAPTDAPESEPVR